MSDMSKIKCAVIGLGMGRGHAVAYAEASGAELVAVSDLNAEQFVKVKNLLKPEACFTDYKEMLRKAKPDIVSIALPNFLHKPVTLDCLAAGAHVLCEKPPALSLKDAREMRDAAIQYKRTLGINLSQRYRYQKIKEQVTPEGYGAFYHGRVQWTRRNGAPKFGGWFGQKKMSGGGPLIDLGVHRIDLAMWLMQAGDPVTVSGVTHAGFGKERAAQEGKVFDVEDFATGLIRFEKGTSLIFESSWIGHQEEVETQRMHLLGKKAALEQNEYRWVKHGIDGEGPYSREVSMGPLHTLPSIQAFVDAIATGDRFEASIEQGLRIQAILDALYLSAERGGEVEISKTSLS